MSTLTLTLAEKKALYKRASDVYFNSDRGESIMTDKAFDKLEAEIRAVDPKWSGLKRTGAKVGKKTAVQLVEPMASLKKVFQGDDAALERFRAKLPADAIIGPKYDGTAIQATYVKGKLIRLMTRGDGFTGKDISYFIPHLLATQLPQQLNHPRSCVVRIEGIIKTSIFEKKYAKDFENARALVNSIFNRQNVSPALKDVTFMILRMLRMEGAVRDYVPAQLAGISEFKSLAPRTTVISTLRLQQHVPFTSKGMSGLLSGFRKAADYDLDGIVITSNVPGLEPVVKTATKTVDKPDWAIAFKNNEEAESAVTTIEELDWRVTRTGRISLRARVKPVRLGGVTVTYATLHNAGMAVANNWGVGARVEIIRSGDVIPKVVKTIKGASVILPDPTNLGIKGYTWQVNDKGVKVHLVIDKEGNEDALTKSLIHALQSIGVEHLSADAAKKMVAAGCPSPMAMIAALYHAEALARLSSIGISEKMAEKGLATLPKALTMDVLMVASGLFPTGIGRTVLAKYAGLMRKGDMVTLESVADTFGPKTAEKLIKGLQAFSASWCQYMGAIPLTKPKAQTAVKDGPLKSAKVSWTGYRSKEEEDKVLNAGGEVVKFGSSTTILLYKDGGKSSTKVDKARAKGIRVVSFKELSL